jgi:hypothetical protein
MSRRRARRRIDLNGRLAVTTRELGQLLGVGRHMAGRLARQLGVQVGDGGKILISVDRVRRYLDGDLVITTPTTTTGISSSEGKA